MGKRFLYATATLIGATIGAGILGIPFVVAKTGVLIGITNVIMIGIAIAAVNLCMGEIILRTKKSHQMTGYAEIYLGKTAKFIMSMAMMFLVYGAMIAYTIGNRKSA